MDQQQKKETEFDEVQEVQIQVRLNEIDRELFDIVNNL